MFQSQTEKSTVPVLFFNFIFVAKFISVVYIEVRVCNLASVAHDKVQYYWQHDMISLFQRQFVI